MRHVRFLYKKKAAFGAIKDSMIHELSGPGYMGATFTGIKYRPETVQLLAPVVPSKIICIGLNYVDHIEEFGRTEIPQEPVIFMKPPSALIGPEQNIQYPAASERVDYEAELAVVIGKTAKDVNQDEALKYVFGYTCGNDVTARDLQRKDGQWTRGKSFDTFCPLGPWIETELDPGDLSVQSRINGEIRQDSRTRNMIFPVPRLIEFISGIMTLIPGDVIMTGTPSGVDAIQPGDRISIIIEGIGELHNTLIK